MHAALRLGRWALLASMQQDGASTLALLAWAPAARSAVYAVRRLSSTSGPEGGGTEELEAWQALAAVCRQHGSCPLPDSISHLATERLVPDGKGTAVVVGGLWDTPAGQPELDGQAASDDIRVAPEAPGLLADHPLRVLPQDAGTQRCLALNASLRALLAVRYLRQPAGLTLQLRGVAVDPQNIRCTAWLWAPLFACGVPA